MANGGRFDLMTEEPQALSAARALFNSTVAPALAAQLGPFTPASGSHSKRFTYFEDETRFVVVSGEQEEAAVDLALAYGLTYCGQRKLVLLLPERYAFPTLQRAPWFQPNLQPEVWLHDGAACSQAPVFSQDDTVRHLAERLKEGQTVEEELHQATKPRHLGGRSRTVAELVEWATRTPVLDGGHRRGERAWHCMGQKVLSIQGSAHDGLRIRAGIHTVKPGAEPLEVGLKRDEEMTPDRMNAIQEATMGGTRERLLPDGKYHSQDEHWLQAVIRRDPSLVGIEQPAIRELPAWRPSGATSELGNRNWGRGYIDLVGVDGHGDLRLVETKIAGNTDDLFVLQGLDYYVWAIAYRKVLIQKLGAAKAAELEIHYVVGDTLDGQIHLSHFAPAQARGLDPVIRWRFQTVHEWFGDPGDPCTARTNLLPTGDLPGSGPPELR